MGGIRLGKLQMNGPRNTPNTRKVFVFGVICVFRGFEI
jgi:hypothetical protein